MVRMSHVHITSAGILPAQVVMDWRVRRAQVWVLIQRLFCETAQEPPLHLKPTTVTASPQKAKKKTPKKCVNANAGGLGYPTAFLLSSLNSAGVVLPVQSLTQPCPA